MRSRTLPALVALAILGTSGCAAESSVEILPYAAEFEHARSVATSQFEKDVLADDEITSTEFQEAVDRFIACAADRGIEVTTIPSGRILSFSVDATPEELDRYDGSVEPECAAGTRNVLEPLYYMTLLNPEKVPLEQLYAECFLDLGLVEPPFTADQFTQMSGNLNDPLVVQMFTSDDARGCLQDPLGTMAAND